MSDYKWAVYEWPNSGKGTDRPYLLRFTVARYEPTYKAAKENDPITLSLFTSFMAADKWAKELEANV